MSTKTGWVIAGISALCVGGMVWHTWNIQKENQRLSMLNSIYEAEHRILKDEIYEFSTKPTYEEGYKAALIRLGGPQVPGAYQDGWDDALKIYGENGGYAEGYHAAIAQFGYTKNTAMTRWLVPEPKIANKSNTDGIVPAKLDK